MSLDKEVQRGMKISSGICPVSGLPIHTKPEWTNVRCGENFTLTLSIVGDSIIWSRPSGVGGLMDIQKAVIFVDEIVANNLSQEKGYVQIEDYSNLDMVSLEARRFFIRHMRRRQHLLGLIFCGVSPMFRMSISLAKRLYIGRYKVHVVRDYSSAAKLAVEIADATIKLAKPSPPFNIRVAEDFNSELETIKKEEPTKIRPASVPTAGFGGPKHSTSQQTQQYVDELLKYLGSINWETDGFDPAFEVDPSHPYRPVFDALALIKSDLDDLLRERRRAEEKLQQSYDKLRKAMEGTIRAMAITVERRDPYTAGHQQRVANLACAIAEEMGLSKDQQIDGIRMAGVIHDLGKLSVPAEILSKPGRLSEMEFGIIREHPQVGYDILKEIDFPWPIADMVLQHHERMDGSGYPQGLSNEAILMESKILAVADVVEAMASHRPYRPSLGIEKALEEILENRGFFYDPPVVDACLKLFRQKGFKIE